MTTDLIVNYTPTGMVPSRRMTPHVPLTVSEIIDDVHQACEMGITLVHLHARDEGTGEPTYRGDLYGRMIEGIRRFSPELVVCVSLSGRTHGEFRRRAEPLRLDGDAKPDMGSLTLSSLNFTRHASVNSPDMIQALAEAMQQRGILPELEAFDLGMINYARYLQTKGLLQAPHYFNLLLGNIAGAQAGLMHLGMMVNDLPPDSCWSAAGIGDAQLMMNSVAIAAGGGVRVGLEDNLWYDRSRSRLARNTDLLRRIHVLADVHQRPLMTPRVFRERLNLQTGHGSYGRAVEPSPRIGFLAAA